MKKCILIFGIVAAFFCASCNNQDDIDAFFVKKAAEMNKRYCPRDVGSGPGYIKGSEILDSITYRTENHTFGYNYTINDSLFTDSIILSSKDAIRDAKKKEIINSVSLKKEKENGVSFQYTYYGKVKKNIILRFTFGPDEYGSI